MSGGQLLASCRRVWGDIQRVEEKGRGGWRGPEGERGKYLKISCGCSWDDAEVSCEMHFHAHFCKV